MAEVSESFGSVFADHGSLTPSEHSENEEHSENDSDYETDSADYSIEHGENGTNIQWTGYGKRIPVILFNVDAVCNERMHLNTVGEQFHLTYKFTSTACKIIQNILRSHGFREVNPNNPYCNLIWSNSHPKPSSFRFLAHFQKINHFPRSYELTRKDRLCRNMKRMQLLKGHKHFNFMPASFVLPGEYKEFCTSFEKNKGLYIVKPIASSQGKGVFLVNHPDQVPEDEQLIVSKYISSPLVIEDFKFDIRVYVAVTSYDPLIIYLYEEGLTRFATVKYENNVKYMKNSWMHLTNSSVNKRNRDYVKNNDPDVEDYGSKWSMGAMLRHLRSQGKDTADLMMKIESVVIKTILSAEPFITPACDMHQPFRGNCFELYGFDILIDEHMKPWVLEVNVSPALACDTPLDMKIKSNLLCDLFSLIGIVCQDPSLRNRQQFSRLTPEIMTRPTGRLETYSYLAARSTTEDYQEDVSITGLNSKEIKILRRVKEEETRKGGWIRIFPTSDSWDLYGTFLQFSNTYNWMLHRKLYPDRHKEIMASKSTGTIAAKPSSSKSKVQHSPGGCEKLYQEKYLACAKDLARVRQYEGMLGQTRGAKKCFAKILRRKEMYRLMEGDNERDDDGLYDKRKDGKTELPEDKFLPDCGFMSYQIPRKTDRRRTTFTKLTDSLKTPEKEKEKENVYYNRKTAALDELDSFCFTALTPSKNNVISLLHNGQMLSEVQARTAFSTYLTRVEERFRSNWSTVLQKKDVHSINDQMKLIFQFLKCAAENLPQPLHVVIPNKKISLGVRKKLLAKQLDIFINIYCKDTERMKEIKNCKKLYNRNLKRSQSYESINEIVFDEFVSKATEDELEVVLLMYASKNKSDAVFLGRDSKMAIAKLLWEKNGFLQHCHDNQEPCCSSGTVDDRTGGRKTDVNVHVLKTPRTASHHISARLHYPSSPQSYTEATAIYTRKPRRPWSATSSGTSASSDTFSIKAVQHSNSQFLNQQDSVRKERCSKVTRPVSATAQTAKVQAQISTPSPAVDACNMNAVQDSLRRLTLKHQYSFKRNGALKSETVNMKAPSQVTHSVTSTGRHSRMADDHSATRLISDDNFTKQPSCSGVHSHKPSQTQQRALAASNNFTDVQNPQLKNDAVYNEVTKGTSSDCHMTRVNHSNRRPNSRR